MQDAIIPPRRGRPPKNASDKTGVNVGAAKALPKHVASHTSNELTSSNLTTSHFLGVRERSWMKNGITGQNVNGNSPYAPRPVAGLRDTNRKIPPSAGSAAELDNLPSDDAVLSRPSSVQVVSQESESLPSANIELLEQPTNAGVSQVTTGKDTNASADVDNTQRPDPTSLQSTNVPADTRQDSEVEVVDLTFASQDSASERQNETPAQAPTKLPRSLPNEEQQVGRPPLAQLQIETNQTAVGPSNSVADSMAATSQVTMGGHATILSPRVPVSQIIIDSPGPASVGRPQSTIVDLDGFTTSCPTATSSQSSGQLLTPVASPEQLAQSLSRKRPIDPPAAMTAHPLQPPQTRLRTDSPQQLPPPGHVSCQSSGQRRTSPAQGTTAHNGFVSNIPPAQPINSSRMQNYVNQSRPVVQTFIPQPGMPSNVLGIIQQEPPRIPPISMAPQQHHRRSSSFASPVTPSKGQSYLAVLDNMVSDAKKNSNLDSPASFLRLPWLRYACQSEDLAFLLLNQITCASDMDKGLMNHLGLDKIHIKGIKTLQLLLGANSDMSRDLVASFACWPNSLYSLKSSPQLSAWITSIARSLYCFGVVWEAFRANCIRREFPPSASEVFTTFHCDFSTTLSRVVFSSLCRQVTPFSPFHHQAKTYGDFQSAMSELFEKDQNKCISQIRSGFGASAVSQAVSDFDLAYLTLFRQHFPQARSHPGHLAQPVTARHQSLENVLSPQVIHGTQTIPNPPTVQSRILGTSTNANIPNDSRTACRPGSASSRSMTIASNGPNPPSRWHANDLSPAQTHRSINFVPPTNFSLAASPTSTISTSIRSSLMPPGPHHLSTNTHINTANGTPGTTFPLMPASNSVGIIQQTFMQGQFYPVSVAPAQGNVLHHVPMANPQPGLVLPFLPQINQNPMLANPEPRHEALHQAHLRQPTTKLGDTYADKSTRLYQFMDNFILKPQVFSGNNSFLKLNFDIDAPTFSRLAQTNEKDDAFSHPVRLIDKGSLIVNLRCTLSDSASGDVPSSTWAAQQTCWPEIFFVSVNNRDIEIRRKRQYKKDLPVDITAFVNQGSNELVVSFYADKSDQNKVYAIGCETITFEETASVTQMPEKLSSSDSLNRILQSMQPATADDDDDMQMVTDSLVISVSDPFSSSLYQTPVRSKICIHRECFSLETYLQSRTSDNNDILTSVYQWLCPHCKRDARPCNLVVDGFMQEVCQRLISTDDAGARAIVLNQDGSWTVRKEQEETEHQPQAPRDSANDDTSKTDVTALNNVPSGRSRQQPANDSAVSAASVEVIDLDSD